MSPFTALILCTAAIAVGFLAASICQAAAADDAIDAWHKGKEYGYRMGVAAERRAVELRTKPEAPFDWAEEREQAKAKHPSTWVEAHADRGPWPA